MKRALLILLLTTAWAQGEWTKLDETARALMDRGDIPKALDTAGRALAAAGSDPEKGRSLTLFGYIQHQSGQYVPAEENLRAALKINERIVPDSAELAETAVYLAMLLRDSRRFAEAQQYAEMGLKLRERSLGGNHYLYAESLNILASIIQLKGDFPAAERIYEDGKRIHEAQTQSREEYGTLLVQLAQLQQRTGNFSKARVNMEKALAVYAVTPGKHHYAFTATLGASAHLDMELGELSTAESKLLTVLSVLPKQLGPQHPLVAVFLNNLGTLYHYMGNITRAESLMKESLAIKTANGRIFEIAIGTRNLGLAIQARNPEESGRLYAQAVALFEKIESPPAVEYSRALLSLGDAYLERGELSGAEKMFLRIQEIVRSGLSTDHPLFAEALTGLARIHHKRGQFEEAEKKFTEAIEIITRSKGGGHPDQLRRLLPYAVFLTETGRAPDALAVYRRAWEIQKKLRVELMATGVEAGKAEMLGKQLDFASTLLNFQRRFPSVAAWELAYEASAGLKGIVIESGRDWRLRMRTHAGGDLQHTLDEWQAYTACRAALSVAVGYRDWQRPIAGACGLEATPLAGKYGPLAFDIASAWRPPVALRAVAAISELTVEIDRLEKRLDAGSPAFRAGMVSSSAADVAPRLRPEECLLEFVRYRDGARVRYGLFALRGGSPLQWMDLGPAAGIENGVKDLIRAAEDWSTALARGENALAASAASTAENALDGLSREALAPMWRSLASLPSGVTRLRIATDGLLTLLPFEALRSRDKFLLERFSVGYVSSSRQIGSLSGSHGRSRASIIAVSPGVGAAMPDPSRRAFRTGRLTPLRNAEREAASLSAGLIDAELLGPGLATEAAIKNLRSPALLHIIGHGVVDGKDDCSDCALASLRPAERIMGLSAIVLEEAYGRGPKSSEDGLLTALELQTLDFDAVELLVLSQCSMADGVPTSGDGVYGMRRAAELAGAKTFVAPLWKVADSAQSELMNQFYRELRMGQGRAEALRTAKLRLMRSAPNRHFLYWAPVILAGEAGVVPAGIFAPIRPNNSPRIAK